MQTYAPGKPGALVERSVQPADHEVTRVETLAALPDLEPAWRALETQSAAGIFAGYEWAKTVATHLLRNGRLHVALANRAGAPIGLATLAYRRFLGIRTLALLSGGAAEYPIADYQDILLQRGHELEALRTLLDDVEKAPWDFLWLRELPNESAVPYLLPQLARARGWRVVTAPASDVHRVELPDSWEAYLGGLSASWRKEIRSKLRRLETEHGAEFRLIERDEDIDPAMQALFDLHTQRWNAVGQPGIFSTERSRAFYKDLAHVMHAAGRLYLATLVTAAGETIGAGFGFDNGGTRFAYTYGYKPGPEWEKSSLGLMLDCLCIRNAIDKGLTRVDLMRSEGEYKKRYGAVRADNVEVMVFRSRTAYLRVMAYRRLRATAKRLLKRH